MDSSSRNRKRAPVGLGDMVRLLQAFPGEEERIASLLGYEYVPPKQERTVYAQGTATFSASIKATATVERASTPLMPHFWYVKERERKPANDDAVPSFDLPKPVALPNIQNTVSPPFSPLLPWAGLWPFLKDVLGKDVSSREPDVDTAVSRLARGEYLTDIPRKKRVTWADRVRVVVDNAPRLFPFWGDFNQVVDGLSACLSPLQLTVSRLKAGPFGMDYDPHTLSFKPFDLRPFDVPVLILSDLGVYGGEQEQEEWRRYGERLRRHGLHPVVLTPVPARLWSARHNHLFHRVVWDDTTPRLHLQRQYTVSFSDDSKEQTDTHVETLLALCSTAVRVEPRLLRAVRRCLPGADVGTEGLAWNHADVESTFLAFSFQRGKDETYREKFDEIKDTTLRREAVERIRSFHTFLPPEVQMEERLAQHLFRSNKDDNTLDADLIAFLGWFQNQQSEMGDPDAVKEWLRRMRFRQSSRITKLKEATFLRQKWVEVFQEEIKNGNFIPPVMTDQDIAEATGKAVPAKQIWQIIQVGNKLVFRYSDKEKGGIPLGCMLAQIQAREKIIIENASNTVSMELKDDFSLPLPQHGELTLRTDDDVIVFANMQKPDWAESISWSAADISWSSSLMQSQPQKQTLLSGFLSKIGLKKSPPNFQEERKFNYIYSDLSARLPLNDSIIQWTSPDDLLSTLKTNLLNNETGHNKHQGRWINLSQYYDILEQGVPDLSWAQDHSFDQYGLWAAFEVSGVRQVMRWIRPGTFLMGSPKDEPDRSDDEFQHEVTLTSGFWLADTTCTQALWTVIRGKNPSKFTDDPELPVEQVSWDDCQEFLHTINQRHPALQLQLPTEAQWEYACRAGTVTPFSFGENMTPKQVNYNGNYPYHNGEKGIYREKTVPVKVLPCNQWGLYQMHGNVWEWCSDRYAAYPDKAVIDPQGSLSGGDRVLRGGSWLIGARNVRSAYRYWVAPEFRFEDIGFRFFRGR